MRSEDHSSVDGSRTSWTFSKAESTSYESLDGERFHWSGLVGREYEQEQVQQALERGRTSAEALLIHGASGSGKSFLVQRVVSDALAERRFLVGYGKYDQGVDSVAPYEAISHAVTDVCTMIGKDQALVQEVVGRVSEALHANEIELLVQMIPNIKALLQRANEEDRLPGDDIFYPSTDIVLNEATVVRFNKLFRRFLLALATEEIPLVLFLDDLQWADDASRTLLDSVTKDPELCHFLLIGTVRDGELTTFAIDRDAVFPHRKLVCDDLSVEAVTKIVAGAVRLDPKEPTVMELGELVHRRCNGNPFFAMQFVEQLARDQHIWFSEENKVFEWNMTNIQANTSVTANVVDLLVSKISGLSRSSRSLLLVFAILGHSADHETLSTLLENKTLAKLLNVIVNSEGVAGRKINVKKGFQESIRQGLIEKTKSGQFKFVHDRVQQAATRILQASKAKAATLSTLGGILLEMAKSSKGKDWMLFSATNLLVKYRGSLSRGDLARLCVESSQKACSQAAFSSAAIFADAGIKLLEKSGWKDYYELQIDLHNVFVEANFALGNWNNCKKRIKAIKEHSLRVEDTYRAFNCSVQIKVMNKDWGGSIDECLRGMKLLGVDFPRNPSPIYMVRLLFQVRRLMKGRSPTQLLADLPESSDDQGVELLHLVSEAITGAYWGGDDLLLCTLCILSLKLTIQQGRSSLTPFSFMSFGAVLTVTGPVSEAYEFAECAKDLAERTEISRPRTFVTFGLTNFHLKNRMRDQIGLFKLSTEIALQEGDALSIGNCSFHTGVLSMYCGRTLQDAKRYVVTYPNQLFLINNLITNLTSLDEEESSISGEFFNDREVLEMVESNRTLDMESKTAILEAHHCRMWMYYILGMYDEGKADIKKHRRFKELVGLVYSKLLFYVVCALTRLAAARKAGTSRAKIQFYRREIKKYDILGAPDIPAFLAFISAEEMSLKKSADAKTVIVQYRSAIELLREGFFPLFEAKALERLGEYLLDIPEYAGEGRTTLQASMGAFDKYGAVRKARDIRLRLNPVEAAPPLEIVCHST